jgi:hypothetical protein
VYNNEYYQQTDGLAMGAPTSAIIAEIFIQQLEHTMIIEILRKHYIIDYYRYVDGILIIYNTHATHIDNTLADFNTIHPNIQFTIEKEIYNKLNYLDLTIVKYRTDLHMTYTGNLHVLTLLYTISHVTHTNIKRLL